MPVCREETVRKGSVRADRAYAEALERFRKNDISGAIKACRRALKRRPDHGSGQLLMGLLLYNLGDQPRAIEHLDRAVDLVPDNADAHSLRARVLERVGRDQEAGESHIRAHSLAPDSVPVIGHFGEFLRLHGRPEQAMALFLRALKLEPHNPEILLFAGKTFDDLGMSDKALSCFRLALVGAPDNAPLHTAMGDMYMKLGKRNEAATCFRAALDLAPGLVAAHLGLVIVESGAPSEERLEMMRALGRSEMSVFDQVNLHFALGLAYDRCGRDEEAVAEFVAANGLRDGVTGGPFDLDGFRRETAARIEVFDRAFFEARTGWGVATEKPVFIVGMPRSGTTLVESILSSHPDGHGAGELKLLPNVRHRIEGRDTDYSNVAEMPDRWRTLTSEQMHANATAYLDAVEKKAPGAKRIVDKMPHNFLNLWLIALMFPEASVIHCRRDPRDTCLSIFMQVFREGNIYKNDLRTLGLYYREYVKLMDHWARALPNPPLDVRYEDLVADQEGVSRRIVAHCGLDWDPVCLDFHAQDRSVRTASALQVRKKIYGTSVGRWRRYERHLGPLLDALGPIEDGAIADQSQPDNAAETRQ